MNLRPKTPEKTRGVGVVFVNNVNVRQLDVGDNAMLRNENALQTKVLDYLRALEASKWENRSPGFHDPAGVPDITGAYRGRPVVIELKNPNDHHEPGLRDTRWPAQRKFLQKIKTAGGLALGTNDFEMVRTLIRYVESEVDDNGISRVPAVFWERFI
jgi:hypothetical protein